MKSIKAILSALFLAITASAMGQQVDRLGLTDVNVQRLADGDLNITMRITPKLCHLGRNSAMKVVPVIYSSDSTYREELPAYWMAGKNQYYYHLRSDKDNTPLYRSGSHDTDLYYVVVPWQDWMSQSTIGFDIAQTTCCGKPEAGFEDGPDFLPIVDINYLPPVIPIDSDLQYIDPAKIDMTKEYALEGKAYVNFPVNRTEIFPDYLNNPVELKKITGSIDTVRNNPDATITSITLTGYASPEGPYENNVRLARGRTQAVRDYVSKLYPFPPSIYITASVPEDWTGLRENIEKSNLPMRNQMLSFIDSDYPIQKRNDRFRELFPSDYAWLLQNVYPWLRHTDYLIKYNIRHYTDIEEIKQVLATNPGNLSLDEIYLLAQTYPTGSQEYIEIFDTAARLFPNDPLANINAANTAIGNGELDKAEAYLLRAGESADANYARGMFYAKKKEYDKALNYLYRCGTPKAQQAINRIGEIQSFKGSVVFRNHGEQ